MHASKSKSGYTSASDFVPSLPQKPTRMFKETSFKNIRGGQNARNEKCSTNLSELQACFVQLEEELKNTKHYISSPELKKRQPLLKLEECNNNNNTQISVTNAQYSNEDDRIQQLCKLSQERDKAWALELAAVKKHHWLDTTALASAKIEIQKLKKQLQMEQSVDCAESEEDVQLLKNKTMQLKSELNEVRGALEECKERYKEEYLRSTLQIRDAYEQVEVVKSESRNREAKLAVELETARVSLSDMKKQLQAITEENERMKVELQNVETERNKAVKRAAEARKIEADRSSRRVARLMEQLEAAQAAGKEAEMELRRQKVQCEQWKKAAETAAAMVNRDSDKRSEKNETVCNGHVTSDRHLGSETCSDDDDDATKRKSVSVLQKMGVLWKKSNSMKLK